MNLTGKTIIITGGTSGIGQRLVERLSEKNTVIVIAKNQQKLKHLQNKIPSVKIFCCDLFIIPDLEKTAEKILQDHAHIDVLINNAAIQNTALFLDQNFDYKSIQKEINVNFTAVCSLTFLLLPALIKNTRSIILNVNSGLGLVPKTSSAVYCGTKGGLYIFSKSLKYQLERSNIKVLQAIMPLVNTAMTAGRGKGKITDIRAAREIIKGIEKEIPEHFIGKAKLLRILLTFLPGIAKKIMKGA